MKTAEIFIATVFYLGALSIVGIGFLMNLLQYYVWGDNVNISKSNIDKIKDFLIDKNNI